MKKIKNWWWYYKIPVLIALAAAAILIYLFSQSAGTPEPDYHIGLVRASGCSEEESSRLESYFAALGQDQNGDGEVLVQLHIFAADLADTSENAGYRNFETIAALDADLAGKVSGIFLLEDPDAFLQSTNDILAEPVLPWEDGLYLALRKDADNTYTQLFSQLA